MFSTFFAHYIVVHHYSVVYDGCYDVGVQKMTGSAEAAKQFFLANNCVVVVVVVVVGIIKNEIFKLLYVSIRINILTRFINFNNCKINIFLTFRKKMYINEIFGKLEKRQRIKS